MSLEITNKEEAIAAIAALNTFVESLPDSDATDAAPADADEATGDAPAEEEVSLPSAEDLANKEVITKDQIPELATKLGLDTEGKKVSELRALLVTLATIAEEGEVEAEGANALAEALGLTPDKKLAKTVAAIKEWIEAQGSEGEASTEDEAPAASSDDDDDAPAASNDDDDAPTTEAASDDDAPAGDDAGAAEPDSDGVARAKIAKTFKKFPDLKTMVSRLTAYNNAAGEDKKIEFNAKKEPSVKDAYRSLVAEMVDSSENITEWGVAYFRDNGGWCCGLPLDDAKIKGQKTQCGRCVVTKKAFALSADESEFTPVKG